jgi:hypothetical protein
VIPATIARMATSLLLTTNAPSGWTIRTRLVLAHLLLAIPLSACVNTASTSYRAHSGTMVSNAYAADPVPREGTASDVAGAAALTAAHGLARAASMFVAGVELGVELIPALMREAPRALAALATNELCGMRRTDRVSQEVARFEEHDGNRVLVLDGYSVGDDQVRVEMVRHGALVHVRVVGGGWLLCHADTPMMEIDGTRAENLPSAPENTAASLSMRTGVGATLEITLPVAFVTEVLSANEITIPLNGVVHRIHPQNIDAVRAFVASCIAG